MSDKKWISNDKTFNKSKQQLSRAAAVWDNPDTELEYQIAEQLVQVPEGLRALAPEAKTSEFTTENLIRPPLDNVAHPLAYADAAKRTMSEREYAVLAAKALMNALQNQKSKPQEPHPAASAEDDSLRNLLGRMFSGWR